MVIILWLLHGVARSSAVLLLLEERILVFNGEKIQTLNVRLRVILQQALMFEDHTFEIITTSPEAKRRHMAAGI